MNEFGIVSALILLGILLLMAGNVVYDFFLIQTWTKTNGKVTNTSVEKYYDDSFEYYKTNIRYEYKIDNTTINATGALDTLQSREIAESVAAAYPKNKPLLVYVNPSNAKESKIELELNKPDAISYSILLAALVIILILIAVLFKIV